MSPTTKAIEDWTVSYAWADGDAETHDANQDGKTNKNDVQAILDYAVAEAADIAYDGSFAEKEADLNGDGIVNTADAYLLIEWLKQDHSAAAGTVPAKGSRKVTVTITPGTSLDGEYPAGAYVEGFTYINALTKTNDGADIDVEHTIPVLGYYGSWTDSSMFDNTSYTDTVYGTERIPYSGNTNTNYMTLQYNGVTTKFTGNPYKAEAKFPYDNLAVNSNSQIDNFYYNLIRAAGTTGFALSRIDGYGGKVTDVLSSTVSANEVTGLWYYANQGTWQNTGTKFYSLRKTPASFGISEGDMFRVGFYAIPEYNGMLVNKDLTDASAGTLGTASFKNVLLSNVLGEGAYIGYDFKVDNTAPAISEASLSGSTISVAASDNEALAYVAVLSLDGNKVYAEEVPGTDQYTISFDGSEAIANAHGYVAVFAGDYAGNETAKAVKVNDNTYEEKTVYVQTNTLTAGNEYLIVNRNTTGSGYALGHSGTTVATNAVTVKTGIADTNNAVYIESSDAAETSVWTAASGYTFKNGSYYLRYSGRRLTVSTSSSNWTWDSANSRLSSSNYYLTYSGNTFTVTNSAANVYLYVKTLIKTEVDPYGVSSLSVTPGSLDLYKGNESDLVAKVLPLTADDRTVSWTSSNPAVASVDEHGHVIAAGAGNTTITAAANGNSAVTASVDVAVTSVNKNLNGIVWDEEGGVYFSSFNASTLPSYTKLHNEPAGQELVSALMYSSSQLYAGTLDTSTAETEIYSVNRNNYALTDYGTNYLFATDMAPGVSGSSYTQYAGLVYTFGSYLVAGPMAPSDDGEGGTYCGLPYGADDFAETTGDAYFAGVACKSRSSSSGVYYVLDENGVIWQSSLSIGSSVSFGSLTKVVDTGIGTSFLYQNLYYDGTYLYWTHTDNNVAELIIINPATGAVYHAGNFGEGVWPVTGLYVNGSVAPAETEDETMDSEEPLNLTLAHTRDEMMTEEVMSRFNAEAAKYSGSQSGGSLSSLRNYQPAERKIKAADHVRTVSEVKAAGEETNTGVSVTLSENKEAHNGLYKVTYDPSAISFVSNASNSEFSSIYTDVQNGVIYVAYADGEGFKAEEAIDVLSFTEPQGTAVVTVETMERDTEVPAEEPVEYEFGQPENITAVSAAMALEGTLKINFYLNIPDNMLESTYIRMKLGNDEEGILVPAKEAEKDNQGRYRFQMPFNSTQMRDEITVTAEDADGKALAIYSSNGSELTEGIKYSALTYINNKLNSDDLKLAELMRAVNNYGKYAQLNFNYGELDSDPDPLELEASVLADYASKKSGSAEGLTLKSASVECETGTNVHVYFALEEGYAIEDYEFEINGEKVNAEWNASKKYYRITAENINSNKLQTMYEFKACRKGENEGITLQYGVYSYIYSKLSNANTSAEMKNLVKALYYYNIAAIDYFGE